MALTPFDAYFIGICLLAVFYGIYSGIFVLYIHYHASKNGSHKTNNILFYALCILYALSIVIIVLGVIAHFVMFETRTLLQVYRIASTINGLCDCISQYILIYRCWIIWGYNNHVVAIPSLLTLTFLASLLAINGSWYIIGGETDVTHYALTVTSFAISLTINALVTGLIVFRMFEVYREVKDLTLVNRICGVNNGGKTRSIIFILIESGMALFAVQLVQIVIYILHMLRAYQIFLGVHQMLNGITPTIILVRVSMGLSFHDKESMVDVTTSLCFSSDDPNLNTEMGGITSNEHHESGDEWTFN